MGHEVERSGRRRVEPQVRQSRERWDEAAFEDSMRIKVRFKLLQQAESERSCGFLWGRTMVLRSGGLGAVSLRRWTAPDFLSRPTLLEAVKHHPH